MKQHQLMQLSAKNYFIEKLLHENKNTHERRLAQDKILFPFFLIKLANDSCYSIKHDNTTNKVCLFSEKQLHVMYQDEIIKELLKLE